MTNATLFASLAGMQEFDSFLAKHLENYDPQAAQIDKLFGQASARQYFRVIFDDANYVLMKLPGGFSSPAEEITKTKAGAPDEFPFLNVQGYLFDLGLPVPQVFGYDGEAGYILLEDLGDRSFESVVEEAEGAYRLMYYKKAIDLLVQLQTATMAQPPANCVAGYRAFEGELLNWEFDHFLEYGVEDRFKITVPDADKALFQEITRGITAQIAAMPQGFVHRDFQSRNIMFHNMEFYLIDFQDALLGPVLYDLVALLRDSYIDLSAEEVDALLNYYVSQLPEGHPYAGKPDQARDDFYKITLQRKLKDAGRFQYIDTVRGNPNFLVHVPLTLRFLREAFDQVPEAKPLKESLAKFVEEWR